MNTPILDVHLTFTNSATGEVTNIEIYWEHLWALTPPFRPAILNIRNTGKISAKDWRHRETGWYDGEHEFLTSILKNHPDLEKVVDESRLFLYAVFVKNANSLGSMRLRKGSRNRFDSEYRKFCRKWRCCPSLHPALSTEKQPADREDYLKAVQPGAYADLKRILQMLANAC